MKIEPATFVEPLEMINAVLAILTGVAVTIGLVVLAAIGTVAISSALLYWVIGLPAAGLLFALSGLTAPLVLACAHDAEGEPVADEHPPAAVE